jgi:hypothetical protein
LPLASLPSGFPRNPNVLLIRTHPNPSPSVANTYLEKIPYHPAFDQWRERLAIHHKIGA